MSVSVDCNQNELGWTEIHRAAQKGDCNEVERLLKGGTDVNTRTHGSMTPLHIAARKGHIKVARLLIDNGANIDAQNGDRYFSLVLFVFF